MRNAHELEMQRRDARWSGGIFYAMSVMLAVVGLVLSGAAVFTVFESHWISAGWLVLLALIAYGPSWLCFRFSRVCFEDLESLG